MGKTVKTGLPGWHLGERDLVQLLYFCGRWNWWPERVRDRLRPCVRVKIMKRLQLSPHALSAKWHYLVFTFLFLPRYKLVLWTGKFFFTNPPCIKVFAFREPALGHRGEVAWKDSQWNRGPGPYPIVVLIPCVFPHTASGSHKTSSLWKEIDSPLACGLLLPNIPGSICISTCNGKLTT